MAGIIIIGEEIISWSFLLVNDPENASITADNDDARNDKGNDEHGGFAAAPIGIFDDRARAQLWVVAKCAFMTNFNGIVSYDFSKFDMYEILPQTLKKVGNCMPYDRIQQNRIMAAIQCFL